MKPFIWQKDEKDSRKVWGGGRVWFRKKKSIERSFWILFDLLTEGQKVKKVAFSSMSVVTQTDKMCQATSECG